MSAAAAQVLTLVLTLEMTFEMTFEILSGMTFEISSGTTSGMAVIRTAAAEPRAGEGAR